MNYPKIVGIPLLVLLALLLAAPLLAGSVAQEPMREMKTKARIIKGVVDTQEKVEADQERLDARTSTSTSESYQLRSSLGQRAFRIARSARYMVVAECWEEKGWMVTDIEEATRKANEPPTHVEVPTSFALHQNYPNPFNPITRIEYDLPEDCHVRLEIYNLLGQKVATLLDEEQTAGFHVANWDGSTASSGFYLYRIAAGAYTETRRMLLLK